jgi:uncharacterized Zn-binding protein involved in type VI secretion
MPAAARVGDPTGHPGVVTGPGVATVLIGGQPAAVAGDTHTCSMPVTPPHPPGPFVVGSLTVMIGGRPALRVGDLSPCGSPIALGCVTVEIG